MSHSQPPWMRLACHACGAEVWRRRAAKERLRRAYCDAMLCQLAAQRYRAEARRQRAVAHLVPSPAASASRVTRPDGQYLARHRRVNLLPVDFIQHLRAEYAACDPGLTQRARCEALLAAHPDLRLQFDSLRAIVVRDSYGWVPDRPADAPACPPWVPWLAACLPLASSQPLVLLVLLCWVLGLPLAETRMPTSSKKESAVCAVASVSS